MTQPIRQLCVGDRIISRWHECSDIQINGTILSVYPKVYSPYWYYPETTLVLFDDGVIEQYTMPRLVIKHIAGYLPPITESMI